MKFPKPQDRKESQCKCASCKMMCVVSPCFPTPEEVEKLVASGYGSQLMPSAYIDPRTLNIHELIAPKMVATGCIFQNEKGLCQLHDKGLKPLEGRLASHNLPDNGLRVWVCKKWDTVKGQEVLNQLTH